MKVDSSIKSLLQGVSQQPPRDRLPGQCTDQLNMSSDPVSGLTRRPPSDLVNTMGTATGNLAWFDFETKDGIRYIAKISTAGAITIRDLNGVSKTVTMGTGVATYLTGASELAFNMLENQMTIVNKNKIVLMDAATRAYANSGASSKPMGIIQILGGAYGRSYRVSLDGTVVATYNTPQGSSPENAQEVKTSMIALVLERMMLFNTPLANDPNSVTWPSAGEGIITTGTAAFAGANWTVQRYNDIIMVTNNAGTPFKLTIDDDQGNINAKAMNEQVPDISDLPRYAPYNYVARVAKETDPEEDLWVKFVMEDATFNTPPNQGLGLGQAGYWIECVAPGIKYKFDITTMPIVVDYDTATTSFNARRGAWKDRQIGTLVTNPDPSFIGNTINDVTSFQNRLVFLAGSYVIMSRTNRHNDFWIGSASAIVDSDPIDISSTSVEAALMMSAIPHNRDLVVFSKAGQFVVFGRTSLTPANATLVLTTSFEAELAAKPVGSGRNIFFATNFGRFTGVREFYTEGGTDINDTRPITQHVKEFIVGKVRRLVSSSNYDMLAVQTQTDKTLLYVYQFIWSDTEKVQSAWSRWQFTKEVDYVFFDQATMYVIVKDGANFYMYRLSLDVTDAPDANFPIYLDSQFDVVGVNTQFTLPFADLADEALICVQGAGCPNPGMRVPILSVVGNLVTLKYNMNGGNIVGGIPYRSQYIPTMPLFKDQDGVVVATATLVVKHFIVSIQQTGNLNAYKRSKYGNSETVTFEGRIVGDVDNLVGVTALSDDRFLIPFREDTRRADIVIYTEDYLPMTMLDIEWVGQYNKSGKRISTGGSN